MGTDRRLVTTAKLDITLLFHIAIPAIGSGLNDVS
jgi:hypothetical protein